MDELADVLYFVLLELDYKSFTSLSCTSSAVQLSMNECSSKCKLWYIKLVALIGKRLLSRPNFDWRTIYKNFERSIDQTDLFNRSLTHLDTLKVSIELHGGRVYSSIDRTKIKEIEVLEYVLRNNEIENINIASNIVLTSLELRQFGIAEDMIELLSKQYDPIEIRTRLICQVVGSGDLDILKYLTRSHSALLNNYNNFRAAVHNNRDEILLYLLENCPALDEREVINLVKIGIQNGSIACLDILRHLTQKYPKLLTWSILSCLRGDAS